jgi:hypothetical protein
MSLDQWDVRFQRWTGSEPRGLTMSVLEGKADLSEMPAFQPYRGKLAVRNDRGIGGSRGGKGLTQGDQPLGGRGSDTEPKCCVDQNDGCAEGDERD